MKSFVFRTPELNFGNGSVKGIGIKAKQLGASRVLIVTDKGVVSAGILPKIEQPLKDAGIEFEVYSEVQPEPNLDSLHEIVKIAKEGDFSFFIGVGGGSAMDVTKLASLMMTNEGEVSDFLGVEKVPNPAAPVILVATTSGTGSEVTKFALFGDDAIKRKTAVSSPNIMARAAFVDPELTISMPGHVTAATGIDAFIHAVEAYIAVNRNPATDPIALEAIRLIAANLIPAVKNGSKLEARYNMALGSVLAGIVLNNAGAGAVHALAYPVAMEYHVSHGISNVVNFVHTMEYIAPALLERYANMAEAMGEKVGGLSQYDSAMAFLKAIRRLCLGASLPVGLKSIGVDPKLVPALAETAFTDTRLLGNTPYVLTAKDIQAIYSNALND
ncbi:iron-containing alcohol dehydrogenase [Paradesulfitobacterium ferrireducens]|uniref:iron-containing alcohol dehydrogenase n=1 Tax=Paradesulfitobacterium ferrireducens TaxID=2816476 RepID=UPI001A8CB801|nr:iron-containing alcohol dehydrogenase [Paradesulfitobacterium ferrireducens]